MTARLVESWRFFMREAGYIVGQRAAVALRLAKAEAAAAESLTFRWEHDTDPDLSWMDAAERAESHEVLGCVALRPCGACGESVQVASLWGIVDPSPEYRRVVEADLACEVLS